ncbi:formyltransferase family protein [Streptomyces sp. NPDC051776]|uniref:formyltransferase family protein n=1 Tax=Streptomyces sp. NPDC051776 TaxID=3155414 RepID=UPI00341E5FDB
MIFVGRGSLLVRAVQCALSAGHRVDLVCSDAPADRAKLAQSSAPYAVVADINAHADLLATECTDGIVWSINNHMIFRAPVLDSGLRVYNIHNGLLPQHRGLPSVAVLFALLNGDDEYGATLHEVDAGIDTGRVLATQRFPIAPEARYHQVLLRGVQTCHQIFRNSLQDVADGRLLGPPQPSPHTYADTDAHAGYYGLRALRQLGTYTGHPAYARATDLGVAAPYVPEVADALAQLRGAAPPR